MSITAQASYLITRDRPLSSGQEPDYDASRLQRVLPAVGSYQRENFRTKQEIMRRVYTCRALWCGRRRLYHDYQGGTLSRRFPASYFQGLIWYKPRTTAQGYHCFSITSIIVYFNSVYIYIFISLSVV